MSTARIVLALLVALVTAAPLRAGPAETNVPPSNATAADAVVPDELTQHPYLFLVAQHLYRWYLDESDIERVAPEPRLTVWVRALHPKLDPGDRSRMGELTFPRLGIRARVKKADYTIPETGVTVTSTTFKITAVSRVETTDTAPADARILDLNTTEMRDYLFRTRNQREFPDDALLERMHDAFLSEHEKGGRAGADDPHVQGPHIIHLAPLSPVANEAWIFWEDGRMLLRFASDIDLANPAVWTHESLYVRLYDIDRQVVVSLSEAPGSNRFLTRDQVGRALYNCIVLGRRLERRPRPDPKASAGAGLETAKDSALVSVHGTRISNIQQGMVNGQVGER